MQRKKIIYILSGFVIILLGIIFVISGTTSKKNNISDGDESFIIRDESLEDCTNTSIKTSAKDISDTQTKVSETEDTKSADIIFVYVCGAVKNPGVYKCESGQRLFELIDLAGGTTDDAAIEYLNMAREVFDEEKIYVPSIDEINSDDNSYLYTSQNESYTSIPDFSLSNQSTKVNINTADKSELMTLPGIGDAKADAILAYRQSNGRFNDIREIKNVSGIKDSAFEKIKDNICVN